MVANKSCGFSSSSRVISAVFELSFLSSSLSVGRKDRKATSEPERSPDNNNRKETRTNYPVNSEEIERFTAKVKKRLSI